MLKLVSFSVENYKSFKTKNQVAIKPLTVFLGKNSSGKSAIARVPLLLSKSFTKDAVEPIKIKFQDLEFGGAFKDLICDKFEHGSISFSLVFSEETQGEIIISFKVQNFYQSPIQMITAWSVSSSFFSINLELNLPSYNQYNPKDILYLSNYGDVKVTFKGAIPVEIKDKSNESICTDEIALLKDLLNNWAETINYLGPFRAFPDRIYRHYGQVSNSLGYKGENAPNILGMSTFMKPELLVNVSDWYVKNLGGWGLSVENDINSFEIVLVSPDNKDVKINLVDVGHGMSQVLPIVVMCYTDILKNSIEIIEQPELHLHPAAHGELAELFVEAIKKNSCLFMVETHSEIFLLRLRRLIIEGKIKPEDCIVYWINDEEQPGSNVEEITFDEDGTLSSWPVGVFAEDHEEVIKIHQTLRRKNSK